MDPCEALIQEKESGREEDEAVAILQLPADPLLETSLLEGQGFAQCCTTSQC